MMNLRSLLRICGPLAVAAAAATLVSCTTLGQGDPKPERDRISSMPHNIPQPWEGQAGMPGMMSGQY